MRLNFLSLITLLITLASGQTNTGAADPCAKIAYKSVIGYKDALACYDSFKLTDKIRNGVSDTLKKILPFYAFIDIAKRSPDPKVPSYIDIRSELDKVLSKKYDTERDFQISIVKFFNTLEDGHTRYTSNCFSSFIFRQPFPLYTEEGKWGEIKVKIPQDLQYGQHLLDAWEAAGVDVLSYSGAEVLSIDGKQPLEFVEQYAKHYVGTSRDVNSRVNYALARSIQSNGEWGISYGSFGSTSIPPVKETLKFRIRVDNREKEVIVPYIATPNVQKPFTDAKSFYEDNCEVPDLDALIREIFGSGNNKLQFLEVPEVKEIPIEAPLKNANSRLIDPLLTAVVDGTYIKTYILPDSVGVVHISTFSAQNESKWYNEIMDGFKMLQDEKVEKLILDVSNNGGGAICWGYNVLDYLFPNASTKFFNTDMHYSPLLAKLTQNDTNGFFAPIDYNQPDGKPFTSKNAFANIKSYYRGTNRNSQYTPQFQEKCDVNPLRSLLVGGKQPFKTENIALISNSICYSTCTLLSNGMQEFHNVKSYAFGGLKYKDATIGSLAGGTVYTLDSLFYSLEYSGLDKNPAAPQPLPIKGGVRFTVREAYSSRFKEPRPLEFTWNPAKNHKAYTAETAFNPYKVWEQVAKDLK